MRKALFCAAVAATLFIVMPAAPAAAQERHSCGNYGYTEGADEPRFTDERVVGAAVEDIRTRVIGCRKARRMVKAFWNGRWDCSRNALRCTAGSFTCRNRRLGEEYWLMRCFASGDRMLKFRFGS